MAGHREAQRTVAALGDRNPRFNRVHQSWDRFRRDQQGWFRVAEDPTANFLAVAERGCPGHMDERGVEPDS